MQNKNRENLKTETNLPQGEVKTDAELQSRVVDWLRFPLAVAVVFIHAWTPSGGGIGSWATIVISDICASIAVPAFFFVSGYYFFYDSSFDGKSYLQKIKKRIFTLFIPFIFWNFMILPERFFVYLIYSDWKKYLLEVPEVLLSFPALNSFPPNASLWFVRDLMILAFVSPVIYWLVRNLQICFVVFAGMLWIAGKMAFPGQYGWETHTPALFFFSTGAFFSLNKRIFLADFERFRLFSFMGYPVCAVLDFLTRGHAFNAIFHCLGILMGILFAFNLTSLLLKSGKIKINAFLLSVNFFLFASHWVTYTWFPTFIRKGLRLYGNYPPEFWYFFSVAFMILSSLGSFYILRRFFPRFTAVITGIRLGGRVKNA
jgi:peptidoglycan/LPS O-acetylase OafA/YrhL